MLKTLTKLTFGVAALTEARPAELMVMPLVRSHKPRKRRVLELPIPHF